MYDRYDDEPWSAPTRTPLHAQDDLVTHLVFVGGRLADSWSEDARDGAYADFARSLAQERLRAASPPPPEVPAHVRILAWLDSQAGGRASLLDLSDEPITGDGTGVPVAGRSSDQQRLSAAADLIDDCADALLRVEEWGHACRRALPLLWASDRELITQAPSAAHVAAGIVWAVGRANGWFPTSGHSVCTQSELRDHLGLTAYPSGYGKVVQSSLRAALPASVPTWGWGRAATPDLAPLGRPDLLTASTRRTLLRLRDQALASERVAGGGEFYQAG